MLFGDNKIIIGGQKYSKLQVENIVEKGINNIIISGFSNSDELKRNAAVNGQHSSYLILKILSGVTKILTDTMNKALDNVYRDESQNINAANLANKIRMVCDVIEEITVFEANNITIEEDDGDSDFEKLNEILDKTIKEN